MVTDVRCAQQHTRNSSFTPTADPNDPEDAIENPNYNFLYQFRYRPLARSLLITPWGSLANLLLKGANTTIIAQADQRVRESAVSQLSATNAALSIVHFNSVAIAGQA